MDRRASMLAHLRERVAARLRPALGECGGVDNAAVRYRMAFARVEPLPADLRRALASAEKGDTDPLLAVELLRDRCAPVPMIKEAQGCRRCDWELEYDIPGSTPDWIFSGSRTLATCLIVEGHIKLRKDDSAGAANAYVEALTLGIDLGTGDLNMNVVGLAISNAALRSLAALVASKAGAPDFHPILQKRLDGLAPTIGSADIGIGADHYSLSRLAMLEAEAEREARSSPLLRVFPGTGLRAWRQFGSLDLLNQLELAARSRDPGKRGGSKEGLQGRVTASRSKAVQQAARDWFVVADEAGQVRCLLRAVEFAVHLEQQGAEAASHAVPASEGCGLRYEPTNNRGGYRIWGTVDLKSKNEQLMIDNVRKPATPP